jgi:hypothetical protein
VNQYVAMPAISSAPIATTVNRRDRDMARRCQLTTDSATIETDPLPRLDLEQSANYVLCSFQTKGRDIMVRAVAEEALALTSITLFLAMVAVWAQVLGVV